MSRHGWFLKIVIILVFMSMGVTVLAQDSIQIKLLTELALPWDAVPGPDGGVIYFTAVGEDGHAGAFSIPFDGGPVTPISAGSSLVMPLGIAISTDGQTLYVTDPWSKGSRGDAVFALSTSGDGVATMVSGTQWTEPQGIEVVKQNGADQLYFTGIDPNDGQPAVYTLPAAGGTATVLAKGAPLVAPSGVAIAADGTVYVLDRLSSGNGLGSVLRIADGKVESIARDVRTGGQLAGLTLTLDESLLLVSSLDSAQDAAQVLVIDLATLQTSIINDVIRARTSAAGLHRAHNVEQYAWAESAIFGIKRPGSGGN